MLIKAILWLGARVSGIRSLGPAAASAARVLSWHLSLWPAALFSCTSWVTLTIACN